MTRKKDKKKDSGDALGCLTAPADGCAILGCLSILMIAAGIGGGAYLIGWLV